MNGALYAIEAMVCVRVRVCVRASVFLCVFVMESYYPVHQDLLCSFSKEELTLDLSSYNPFVAICACINAHSWNHPGVAAATCTRTCHCVHGVLLILCNCVIMQLFAYSPPMY